MDRIVRTQLNVDRNEKSEPLNVIVDDKDENLVSEQNVSVTIPPPPQQNSEGQGASSENTPQSNTEQTQNTEQSKNSQQSENNQNEHKKDDL
jgi:hypothetical protein